MNVRESKISKKSINYLLVCTRWLLNREACNKYAKFDSFTYLFPIKITNIKRESFVNDKSYAFYTLLQPILKRLAAV
jgi:hypothetical protein